MRQLELNISLGPVGASTSQIAGITATAEGGITLNGSIITSDAGTGITFNDNVIIADDTSITITTNSGGTDGGVTFNASISGVGGTDATNATSENLTIDSGKGNVSIASVGVSANTALNNLTINSGTGDAGSATDVDGDITISGNIGASSGGSVTAEGVRGTLTLGNAETALLTLGGTVYNTNTATYTSASGGDKIKLTGQDPVFTASDAAITFAGGNVLIDTSGSASSPSTLTVNNSGSGITFAAINGTDADIIVLNAGTDSDGTAAKVTVGAITAGTPEIKSVTITGNDGVTLNGSISTSDDSGAAVSITGPITLGGDITIDTNVTTNDGSITLGSVDSTDNGQALTIDSGAGNVSIGVIGGTAQLDGLTINTAGAAGDDGDITLAGIGDGTPTYGVVGTVDVGNSRTELLKFTGTSYDVDTGTVTFEAKNSAGSIEIDNALPLNLLLTVRT